MTRRTLSGSGVQIKFARTRWRGDAKLGRKGSQAALTAGTVGVPPSPRSSALGETTATLHGAAVRLVAASLTAILAVRQRPINRTGVWRLD
jgi:hypothetical protein